MRNVIEVTDEILKLDDVDILILFGLITERTAFKFTVEQWDEIAGKAVNGATLPQVDNLLEDVILLSDEDIRSIFLSVGFQRSLHYPIIPIPRPINNPVYVSKNFGNISSSVFHSRKSCSACKRVDKSGFIDEVERAEVEHILTECPICILERDKDRR